MTNEERDILIRWKKRSDTYKLVRMKAKTIVYAARGVGLDIIAEMVERAEETVREWLSEWRRYRLSSVVTGHAGNENAAKLKRAQKEELEEILGKPPSEAGVKAGFWDVPALKDVVQIKFGVEYRSESSYRLLMRFLGMSFKLPDPFDKRRDEKAIARRMAEIRDQVANLLQDGWEVYTVDEVRVEHEAETRRMWLPKGKRTKLYVDRKKASRSFFGALSLTTKKMRIYPIEGNQNAEQTRPHDGSPGARDRRGKEDRSRPGQRQVPPRQSLEQSLCPRPGSRANHAHLHAPLRPRPWDPQNTYGTPPRTISPTPARSPRRTPSRPYPPTSPTAPSTTTSSTSQSHHPTPTLFNSSHSCAPGGEWSRTLRVTSAPPSRSTPLLFSGSSHHHSWRCTARRAAS